MSLLYQSSAALHPQLLPYVADTITRFSYLHPTVEVLFDGESLRILGPDSGDTDLFRELMFCLYREKILAQTLPLRRMLIEGVTGCDRRSL